MKLSSKSCLIFFAIILAFVFPIVGAAQKEYQVMPVDQAKKDASFFAFREKFIAAVKERDVEFLLDALDHNVTGSFGRHDGIEDFKTLWKLDGPNSKLWAELLPVLTNGGAFIKDAGIKNKQFCAPYSYTLFPPELDAFDHHVIFGNNVNLRARADGRGTVIAKLSYNVVKVDYDKSVKNSASDDDYYWLRVETLGGKKGFVAAEFVRSPLDYRACFEKKNGVWKMTAFVAGD